MGEGKGSRERRREREIDADAHTERPLGQGRRERITALGARRFDAEPAGDAGIVKEVGARQ